MLLDHNLMGPKEVRPSKRQVRELTEIMHSEVTRWQKLSKRALLKQELKKPGKRNRGIYKRLISIINLEKFQGKIQNISIIFKTEAENYKITISQWVRLQESFLYPKKCGQKIYGIKTIKEG